MHLLLPLLACGQPEPATPPPGVQAPSEDSDRLHALTDALAAVRELPEPAPVPVRVVDAQTHARLGGVAALEAAWQDHDLTLAGLGLLEEPSELRIRQARDLPPVLYDRDAGWIRTTADGLDHDRLHLAAAQAVLPTCEPAAWTWDARRVAQAVQEGMAVALTWEQDLLAAGLRPRGHAVDPTLPLARWQAPVPPLPTPLDHDDAALELLGADVVLRLLDAGEWRTVDMACRKLPSSTAALLHPERWAAGTRPDPVGPADVPDWAEAGWKRVHTDRVGELAFGTWLAHTARVATPSESRALAAGWRGDALSVWQDDDGDLRAAWTVNLTSDARKQAARLLHGRVLVDGRIVEVRPGPGEALVFLIGGAGAPVLTVLEAAPGGAVAVRLGGSVDAPSWERTLRLQASPVSADGGVARVGSVFVPLEEGWTAGRRGMEGEVLSLRHRASRLRLDLYEAPDLLVGPVGPAAERIARLLASQAGLDGAVHLRGVGPCAVATVLGRDRNREAREIRVHAVPVDDSVLIARASYSPRAVPADYHRLVRTLQDSRCRGPVARRGDYSESTDGQ